MSQIQRLIQSAEQKEILSVRHTDTMGFSTQSLEQPRTRGIWVFFVISVGFFALGIFLISRSFQTG